MSYVALYRVWRPSKWEDVVNQKPVVRILTNALTSEKVSHAYIFSGPRGTGKTTVARLLAKSVNCRNPEGPEPCDECPSCRAITDGSSVDVIEIDAASNRGIDEMRSLRESVRYVPVMGRYKVYIIDEVHMLTQEAFNALLKTLEEPPRHVIFMLATTAPHKIPVTIASRCQRLDFRRLSVTDIGGQLERILKAEALRGDGVEWTPSAVRLIARAGQGSMRDALSILDLCLTYGARTVSEADVREVLGETSTESMGRLFSAIAQKDISTIMDITREASDRGKDMGEMCQEIGVAARDMLLMRSGAKASDLGLPEDEAEDMISRAKALPAPLLISILDASSRAAQSMRYQDDPRLVLEVALLGLLSPDGESSVQPEAKETQPKAKVTKPKARAAQEPAAARPTTPRPAAPRLAEHKPAEPRAVEPKPSLPKVALPSLAEVKDPLEAVIVSWPAVLRDLGDRRKVVVRAYLLEANPIRVDGNTLILAYSKGYSYHMEQIMTAENRRTVEEVIARLTGRDLKIATEVQEAQSQDGSGGGDDQPHPLVRAAMDMFNGRIAKEPG